MTHPNMLPAQTVTVRCPCCGHGEVTVELIQGNWPEDPRGWDIDQHYGDCECYDYMGRAPKTQNVKGVYRNPMPDHYDEQVRERALEEIR